MITGDIELINEIFNIIDNGLIDGYDCFRYEAVMGQGFIDTELSVEINGVETTNALTNMDAIRLYDLADALEKRAHQRGENWTSFVISYQRGGQVRTQFHYPVK
jgi:hypothetical protein